MAIVRELSGNGGGNSAVAEKTMVCGPNLQVVVNDIVNFATFIWPGGIGSFDARATTWGGGSAKLQKRLPDEQTWVDMGTETSLTADGGGQFETGPCIARVLITTATGVTASVKGSTPIR